MNDRKIIADALLEIAKNSTTEFIDDAKIDKEMIKVAEKAGISVPSPDLCLFKTVYAEIDKTNLNGVRLPKKAVEEGLHTLVGKNLNWEHEGSGFVAGYTIKAEINGNKIETINVLFKSLFPNQFEELKEKIKSGEAAVSFEIWNCDPETSKSVVKEVEDGIKEINPIIFHGTGVLLVNPPACPTAKIFQLVAKNLTDTADKVMNKIFNPNLVYAQLAIEEPKCLNCDTCKCEKEVIKQIDSKELICPGQEKGEIILPKNNNNKEGGKEKIMADEIKKEISEETKPKQEAIETKPAEAGAETKVEETKGEETKEIKSEVKPDETPKPETTAEVEKPEAEAEVKEPEAEVKEPKAEAEVEKPEAEEKVEEKKEEVTEVKAQELEVIEPKIVVKVTSIYSEVTVDTYIDGTPSGTHTTKGYAKTITEYKDGTKDEIEKEVDIKKTYTFAELEEALKKAKEELEKLHKDELEAKTSEAKADLDKLIGEKDTEIANLKKELDAKAQEIATAKVEENQPELTVGDVDNEIKSEITRQKENIDKIIANKHKQK